MHRPLSRYCDRRRSRPAVLIVAVVAGIALAAFTAVAVAKSFTLKVAKNVHVTNAPTMAFRVHAVDLHEAVAVGPSGTSAKGLRVQSGIRGKLGTFRNHGMLQLTLNGQPLYYFTPDIQSGNKRVATGDELKTFGSIWHIVKVH
jgi:predicted lipoprotein with Yx(FWY)xxD motif